MPEGGMYDNIFERHIRKIDFLISCSVDSVSKIESLKKNVQNFIFSHYGAFLPLLSKSLKDFGSIDVVSMPIHQLWWEMSTACPCIHSIYKKRPKTAENVLILRNFLQFWTMSAWKKIKGGILHRTNTTLKHQYQYHHSKLKSATFWYMKYLGDWLYLPTKTL